MIQNFQSVYLKVFGFDGVEIGICKRVDWIYKYKKKLSGWYIDQGFFIYSYKVDECNWELISEVSDDQYCYLFCYVVFYVICICCRFCIFKVVVYFFIIEQNEEKCQVVCGKEESNVNFRNSVLYFKWKIDCYFLIIVDFEKWKNGYCYSKVLVYF